MLALDLIITESSVCLLETSLAFTKLKRPMLSETQGNILQFGIVYTELSTLS